jgi:hypothetical protein
MTSTLRPYFAISSDLVIFGGERCEMCQACVHNLFLSMFACVMVSVQAGSLPARTAPNTVFLRNRALAARDGMV